MISYHIISYHIIQYHIKYHIISYHTIPYYHTRTSASAPQRRKDFTVRDTLGAAWLSIAWRTHVTKLKTTKEKGVCPLRE